MMGPRHDAQAAWVCAFSLEDDVPQDHLLRSIDCHLDLSSIRGHLADFFGHTVRPSVDTELMPLILLVEYYFGIRSERRLYVAEAMVRRLDPSLARSKLERRNAVTRDVWQ